MTKEDNGTNRIVHRDDELTIVYAERHKKSENEGIWLETKGIADIIED